MSGKAINPTHSYSSIQGKERICAKDRELHHENVLCSCALSGCVQMYTSVAKQGEKRAAVFTANIFQPTNVKPGASSLDYMVQGTLSCLQIYWARKRSHVFGEAASQQLLV